MKRSIIFLTIILSVSLLPSVTAQGGKDLTGMITRKNGLRITVGGNGILFSGEYSRVLSVRASFFTEASLGIGTVPFSGGIVVPHQFTWNIGRHTNFFEAGLGGTFWTGKTDDSAYEERDYSYSLSPVIGYRKLFGRQRWTFRIFATPLIRIAGPSLYNDWAVTPWAGISIGFNF